MAWTLNGIAFVVDGGAAAISNASYWRPTFAQIGMGCARWSANGNKTAATLLAFKHLAGRAPTIDIRALAMA